MIVGIDIDGVLFPWSDVANEEVARQFDLPDPGPHVEWLHLKKTLTSEQWAWLWSAEGQHVVFSQIERAHYHAIRAFQGLLCDPENRCHFVTHRDPRRAGAHTARYVEHHFGAHPWAGLHVIQNATPKHSLMEWDVFIDDKPSTVVDMLTWTDALVFAPARPWNVELVAIDSPRFVRYEDPREVLECLGARQVAHP